MSEAMSTSVSSDGITVAEAELAGEDPTDLIAEARERGAEVLWVHANTDLCSFGFRTRIKMKGPVRR